MEGFFYSGRLKAQPAAHPINQSLVNYLFFRHEAIYNTAIGDNESANDLVTEHLKLDQTGVLPPSAYPIPPSSMGRSWFVEYFMRGATEDCFGFLRGHPSPQPVKVSWCHTGFRAKRDSRNNECGKAD